MARAFGKQHASKAVRNAVGKGQQGAPVEVHRFFFGASSADQFGLPNNGLDGKSSCPPAEEGASDEVVSRPDDEFLGVLKEDGQRVHQAVGVPAATHGTGAAGGQGSNAC